MARVCALTDAIADTIRDGDIVAMEGFTHLIPFAAAHEVIRQQRRRLTLVRMTPDLIYDQIIGAGCAERLVFSWGGNPGVGSLHRLRDAVEKGWPAPLAVEEYSHAAMANAYEAGAANMPFAVFRGQGFPSGGLRPPDPLTPSLAGAPAPRSAPAAHSLPVVRLSDVNPNFRTITCPFTDEVLTAVPALRPDVAVIHAQKADRDGNVLIEGIVGVQKEAVLAARRSVVTVEEIVDTLRGGHPNACILPAWTVSAIAVVPGGAWPSYAHGYYSRDNAFYTSWDEISRTRETFANWIDVNVMKQGPDVFASRVKWAA